MKRDGTVRTAYCTLNHDLIPSKYEESIQKIFLPDANQDILPFWEITQAKWKSFYVESVELFYSPDELKKEEKQELQDHQHKEITEQNKMGEHVHQIKSNEQKKIETQQKKVNKTIKKINTTNKKT